MEFATVSGAEMRTARVVTSATLALVLLVGFVPGLRPYVARIRVAITVTYLIVVAGFMIHVLPHGFHRIRHYGLLASGTRADNIARARQLLAASNSKPEPTGAAVDPGKPTCPCCGGRMVIIEVFERSATPRHRPTTPPIAIRVDTS